MKKFELKSGMTVYMRNGNKYLVLKNCETDRYGNQEVIFVSPRGFFIGDEFDENLQVKSGYHDLDVVHCNSDKVGGNFFKDIKRKFQEVHPH